MTLASVGGLTAASPALAEIECSTCSPWWHLTAATRPSHLQHKEGSAPGQDEVQEIVTTPGNYSAFTEQTNFYLKINGAKIEEFATKEIAEAFGVTLLSAANIQKALEGENKENNKAYGPGNVTVKEETTDKYGKLLEHGAKRYVITTIGEDANKTVPAIEAEKEIGTVQAAPVTDGVLVFDAVNVGDANTSGEARLVDKLPPGLTPVSVEADVPEGATAREPKECELVPGGPGETATPVCVVKGKPVAPFQLVEMRVGVIVDDAVAKSGESTS